MERITRIGYANRRDLLVGKTILTSDRQGRHAKWLTFNQLTQTEILSTKLLTKIGNTFRNR